MGGWVQLVLLCGGGSGYEVDSGGWVISRRTLGFAFARERGEGLDTKPILGVGPGDFKKAVRWCRGTLKRFCLFRR